MFRLKDFDYKSPFFYMATLKRIKGLEPFSQIGPHGHPPRDKERFCAAGRMLFLSLYEAEARQPTRKELYERCHEMIDHAMSSLPGIEA